MKRFNLVPDSSNIATETKPSRSGGRDLELIIIVLPVVIAVAIVFFLYMNRTQWQAKVDPMLVKKYNSLKKEVATIKTEVQEAGDLASLIQERNRLKTNIQRLKGLTDSKKIPINLLIAIGNNISERIALTVIDKKDQIVSVEGIAQDNESLSDFIDTLLRGGAFSKINLKLTQYSDDYGPYKQRFIMECTL